MSSIFDREKSSKWPRGQRFQLSSRGTHALESYRASLDAFRLQTGAGREAHDAALKTWAQTEQLVPEDALFLTELAGGPRKLDEVVKALDQCGPTKSDVKRAIERLVAVNMVEPAPTEPGR